MVESSDSMEVVQAVLDPGEYRGTSVEVIDDCRWLIALLVETFQQCPREANGAAHKLARFGASQGLVEVWLVDPLIFFLVYYLTIVL
jgi:hypothetical protein